MTRLRSATCEGCTGSVRQPFRIRLAFFQVVESSVWQSGATARSACVLIACLLTLEASAVRFGARKSPICFVTSRRASTRRDQRTQCRHRERSPISNQTSEAVPQAKRCASPNAWVVVRQKPCGLLNLYLTSFLERPALHRSSEIEGCNNAGATGHTIRDG